MIQTTEKTVALEAVTEIEQQQFAALHTADGRFSLANRIQADIDTWFKQTFDDGPRNHLGASIIGKECDRHLWYTFRWWKHKIHTGRMQRLFQDGHWYEERFIAMLRGIGCEVQQVDPETGKQFRVEGVDGHFGGSGDGIVVLSPRYGTLPKMITEFKTINSKGFTSFHDVAYSKPIHWAQKCVYGYKLGIQYGLYFLVNKDDSDLYLEVCELDWELGARMEQRAQFVILSDTPPPKLTENPSDYRCKFCDHYKVCQLGTEQPDTNCRSCQHSRPIAEGNWRCNLWDATIPNRDAMLAGCPSHQTVVG